MLISDEFKPEDDLCHVPSHSLVLVDIRGMLNYYDKVC